MKEFLRALYYLKPYRREIFFNIFYNILYIFFQFFSLTLIAPFVGILFGMIEPVLENPGFSVQGKVLLQWFYYHITQIQLLFGTFRALLFVSALFITFSLFSNLFRYLALRSVTPVRNGLVQGLRNDLFAKILRLPLSFFSEQRKGDLLSRMTNDMGDIEVTIFKALQSIVKDPINILVFAIALFTISAQLMLIVLLILPLTVFIINKIAKSLHRNAEKLQARFGALVSLLEESISGLRIIKSYHVFDLSMQKFDKTHSEYTRFSNKIQRRIGLSNPLSEILMIIAVIGVIWVGGDLVLNGELSAEVMILFVILLLRILSPIKDLAGAIFYLQRGRAALQRVFSILDKEEDIVNGPESIAKEHFEKEIVYRDVTFYYPNQHEIPAINQLSFCLKKNQTLALVGPSGGGKSTLADLLPRFYDCSEGAILIDGVNIRDIQLDKLRQMVRIVSQHCILFNDTVYNNIAFGLPHVSMDDVVNAAKIAYAHDFISEMSAGYYTRLGDNGVNLSGGQRQRLNIARAVLCNPDVLILDEATSALDTESEMIVQKALQNVMKERSALVIAHRLSTVQNADYILVVDQGKIVERGTHHSLMEIGGLYKRLVDNQKLK